MCTNPLSDALQCSTRTDEHLGHSQVAIALGNTAYLWNASDGTIQQLTELSQADDYITSISWAADGKHISVGTASAQVQIWDVDRVKQIRSLRGHAARVTALAWNNTTLSTGGRDSSILNHDVRCVSLTNSEGNSHRKNSGVPKACSVEHL